MISDQSGRINASTQYFDVSMKKSEAASFERTQHGWNQPLYREG
jgi:hypothetical protein